MRGGPMILALTIGAAAGSARAGEAPCWYEHGAVVVSARLGDIAGDFLLDLSAPQSQLHETRAQGDGIADKEVTRPLILAGRPLGERRFVVVDLDARNRGFPTEISGVIGADALAGYVADLSLRPCRIGVWRDHAPRFRGGRHVTLHTLAGTPTVEARVFDGADAATGLFAIDTGSQGVRVAGHAAMLARTPRGVDAASRATPPARLAALTLAGARLQNVPAGLEPSAPAERLGGIGNTVWERYRVRIDLRRGVLELGPRSASLPFMGRNRDAQRRRMGASGPSTPIAK